MSVLTDLGVDEVRLVRLPEEGWHAVALLMIDARRRQVIAAQKRATFEFQQEAVLAELKRMSDLELYVRTCAQLTNVQESKWNQSYEVNC